MYTWYQVTPKVTHHTPLGRVIFSETCLRGHTWYALEGTHDENGGFGNISLRGFHGGVAHRLLTLFPRCL